MGLSFGSFGALSDGLVVIFTPILPDSSENNFDDTSDLRLVPSNSFRLVDADSSATFDFNLSFLCTLGTLSSFPSVNVETKKLTSNTSPKIMIDNSLVLTWICRLFPRRMIYSCCGRIVIAFCKRVSNRSIHHTRVRLVMTGFRSIIQWKLEYYKRKIDKTYVPKRLEDEAGALVEGQKSKS